MMKILVISFALLVSTIASANDMDDAILAEMEAPNGLRVSMKATNQESQSATSSLLAKKYRKFRTSVPLEPNDGMVVAFRPAHK